MNYHKEADRLVPLRRNTNWLKNKIHIIDTVPFPEATK
jgi:hypothetical protein